MKKLLNYNIVSIFFFLILTGCKKEGLEIIDVPFSANKTTVAVGENVIFSVGHGANALAIYTGDSTRDFENSRISLVEQKGYTEQQLRSTTFARRIPDLKEYTLYVPDVSNVPSEISTLTGQPELYNGKLVPWDYSNTTDSRYIKFNIPSTAPYTIVIKPSQAVLPQMLNYNNAALNGLGALSTAANNAFKPFVAFPDGFDVSYSNRDGISVRFSVQLVIDGVASPIAYFTTSVRELLQNLNYNIAPIINSWRTANPTLNPKKGIDEIRFTVNADNPATTDDDGDLLAYKGNMYMQQLEVGDAANMIKAFDKGVTLPYVYQGTTQTYTYTYTKPGTYKAVLVATYIGRKKYSGDGYVTDRADEILASEYEIERRFKTVQITVQ